VILEPTRELAIQVEDQIKKFTNMRSVLVYGGDAKAWQNMKQIKMTKPQVIVATPGRLIDLCDNYNLNLSQSRYQILDEGDKMMDMGFDKDLIKLQKYFPYAQTMIFSATVPQYIQEIARQKMASPLLIDLVGTETGQIPDTISNNIVLITSPSQKNDQIARFVDKYSEKKIIIFTETKREAEKLGKNYVKKAAVLNGDVEQFERQNILKAFRNPKSDLTLVATDVAARGLDIDDIDVVIQYSVKNTDSFVHRTGRTGRAGKTGLNICFAFKDDLKFIKDLEDNLNIKINIINNMDSFKTIGDETTG
jgi:superfamily II DNA/RNA helicase